MAWIGGAIGGIRLPVRRLMVSLRLRPGTCDEGLMMVSSKELSTVQPSRRGLEGRKIGLGMFCELRNLSKYLTKT